MAKEILYQIIQEQRSILDKEAGKVYVPRENLDKAKEFLESNLIKVITGPRRSGKSVFCRLLLKDRDFAYLNFDNLELKNLKTHHELKTVIKEVYKNTGYIMLDEIQNLYAWELFVNELQREGWNIVITGSNANLLSKELSTHLTGRFMETRVFPFSFKEYLTARGVAVERASNKDLLLYFSMGGYPEVVVNDLDPKPYAETLADSIILNDVVERYKIKNVAQLGNLAQYLISSFSLEYSHTSAKKSLQFKSVVTTQNYTKYLQEAYLVFLLDRYSTKPKEIIRSSKKVYLPDTSFVEARSYQNSPNYGRYMENVVFLDLIRRGFRPGLDLFYCKEQNAESDFLTTRGTEPKALIQVSYDIANQKTRERELKGLIKCASKTPTQKLLLLTWNTREIVDYDGHKIEIIPLLNWLLENEL